MSKVTEVIYPIVFTERERLIIEKSGIFVGEAEKGDIVFDLVSVISKMERLTGILLEQTFGGSDLDDLAQVAKLMFGDE